MTVLIKYRSLPEAILKAGLPDFITDQDLSTLLNHSGGKSDDSRYGLVKRAIQQGDLISIRRGLYALAEIYRRRPVDAFELAQRIYGPSYISLESALSYWGLIPEAVYTTISCSSRRSQTFETPMGHFAFVRIPFHPLFLLVLRKSENQTVYFMATPLRALADYVYVSQKTWTFRDLMDSLRIDEPPRATSDELNTSMTFFRNGRVKKFLESWKRENR